jgi:hemoglobin-like flavoprotein
MDLQASLHEVMHSRDGRLGTLFYDRLLSECPQAAPFFDNVNLNMQARILVASLHLVVAQATHNYAASHEYLRVLGHRHQARRIPRELLPVFCNVLVTSLRDFHGERWNDNLQRQWEGALDLARQAMEQGYAEGPVTY